MFPRKRFRIAPGVRLNTGKRGISSLSIGPFNLKPSSRGGSDPEPDPNVASSCGGCALLAIGMLAIVTMCSWSGFLGNGADKKSQFANRQSPHEPSRNKAPNPVVGRPDTTEDSTQNELPKKEHSSESKTDQANSHHDKATPATKSATSDDAAKNWTVAYEPRTWKGRSGSSTTHASLISFTHGKLVLEKDNGSQIELMASKVSQEDLAYLCSVTSWGRVWSNHDGSKQIIADLVLVGDEKAEFERADGTTFSAAISKFCKNDQHFLEQRRGLPNLSESARLDAKVTKVFDGDTIEVEHAGEKHVIRLFGIDAPEIGQSFGAKSKAYLRHRLVGKAVVVVGVAKDKYERLLAYIELGDAKINRESLSKGYSWTTPSNEGAEQEALAKSQASSTLLEKGLWVEHGPIPPWIFRRWSHDKRIAYHDERHSIGLSVTVESTNRSQESAKKPGPATEEVVSVRNRWLNTETYVRHNSSCRWFNNTKHGRRCTRGEGHGCEHCGG